MLPIIILIIVSLLSVLVFFYAAFLRQCNAHEKLLVQSRKENIRFIEKLEKEGNLSSQTKGFFSRRIERDRVEEFYGIREADIIRAGEMVENAKK